MKLGPDLENPAYFEPTLGISLEALLSPVDPAQPAGESLRGRSLYREIIEARREDDPNLPLGPWERDLKRADWPKVSALTSDAIVRRSKDLQLAAWLTEAQIHLHGFRGLAAGLTLLRALCERFWPEVYPQAEDGDLEHRINLFRWVNEKLLPALRRVPLTAAGRDRGEYTWADCEQARRNEKQRAAQGSRIEGKLEGAVLDEVAAALAATATNVHFTTLQHLEEASHALALLEAVLNELCGDEAPGFGILAALIDEVHGVIATELRRRGAFAMDVEVRPYAEAEDPVEPPRARDQDLPPLQTPGPIRDRAEAYARLAEVADFLAYLEPHSPVPYLIKRAVEWGRLNTRELYQHLFMHNQGNINIFDLLGIEGPDESQ